MQQPGLKFSMINNAIIIKQFPFALSNSVHETITAEGCTFQLALQLFVIRGWEVCEGEDTRAVWIALIKYYSRRKSWGNQTQYLPCRQHFQRISLEMGTLCAFEIHLEDIGQ